MNRDNLVVKTKWRRPLRQAMELVRLARQPECPGILKEAGGKRSLASFLDLTQLQKLLPALPAREPITDQKAMSGLQFRQPFDQPAGINRHSRRLWINHVSGIDGNGRHSGGKQPSSVQKIESCERAFL